MAQKNLNMNLVLGGKTTEGFDSLYSKVSSLGEAIDQIGSHAREFEKDSVETYKNYETYMLEAEGALTAQYKSQSQLARVMRGLDKHAQSWAASTIFDTQDVSKAISEAAHAGWSYEQMLEGIPQAMLLAQAGNIDLSTGLDYVIKALNATGTEFADADVMIDQWAMAANSGATNISELGEAILRMGATARFGDSTAELFTMLSVLADMGTVGADAGTLLRNSMIRLIAPTEKASAVMESLGVTEEEMLAISADSASLTKANELLAQTGFSAYDSNGDLKPFLETYKDLYSAVSGMSEVDKNAVLSAIFPTRTITGALGLLEAAAENYDGLYEQILGSDGYAERIAEIQTSGLMGAHEELESKWEEFGRKVGSTLAPLETKGAQFLGGIIDNLNELPEEQLSALVGGLSAIATLGPALTIAGGAMKLFSTLGPYGIGALLLATGLGATAGYLSKISELELKSSFGDLELDLEEIGSFVDGVETKFDVENSAVSQYAQALATAQENYLTLSSTLAEDMLSASLTGKTLSDEEITNLKSIGEQMLKSVLTGMDNAKARDLTFIDMLFGDMSSKEETEAFVDSAEWIDSRYDDLYAEFETIGQQMRNAMTAALADGELDEQERMAIQASVDRLNQIQAEIAARQSEEDYYAQLHKAQSVSWDSVEEYLAENDVKQEEDLAAMDELYHTMYGQIRAAWQAKYDAASTDAERDTLNQEWANTEAEFNREWEAARTGVTDKYAGFAQTAFDALMNGSEYGDRWAKLKELQADPSKITTLTTDELIALSESVDSIKAFGELFENPVISSMLKMLDGSFLDNEISRRIDKGAHTLGGVDEYGRSAAERTGEMSLEELEDRMVALDAEITQRGWQNAGDLIGQWEDVNKQIDKLTDAEISFDKLAPDQLPDWYNEYLATLPEDAALAGEEAKAVLEESYGKPDLDTARIDQEGLTSQAYSAGSAAAQSVISAFGTPVLTATVQINTVGAGSLGIKPAGGSSGSSWLNRNTLMYYAEGGRADEASIFGEAGPEWAIPEEHSERTANLLNLARQASGFTWGDLISRYGGLNASAGQKTVQLTYSPTIHAGDARGIEQILLTDKERLMRMLRQMTEEINMRNDAEVYA